MHLNKTTTLDTYIAPSGTVMLIPDKIVFARFPLPTKYLRRRTSTALQSLVVIVDTFRRLCCVKLVNFTWHFESKSSPNTLFACLCVDISNPFDTSDLLISETLLSFACELHSNVTFKGIIDSWWIDTNVWYLTNWLTWLRYRY